MIIKISGRPAISQCLCPCIKRTHSLFKDFREKLWDLLSQAMLFNCAKENGGGMEEVGRRVQPKRSRRSQIIHRYMYIYFRGERLLISSFANFFFPLKSTQVSSLFQLETMEMFMVTTKYLGRSAFSLRICFQRILRINDHLENRCT